MSEQDLAKKVAIYQELAKANPKVDVGMLMLNALQNQNKNSVSVKAKRWAYIITLSIPFVGLGYWLYYFYNDKDDARQVANMCLILTVVCLASYWLGGKLLFSATGADLNQIKQFTPAQIQELGQ